MRHEAVFPSIGRDIAWAKNTPLFVLFFQSMSRARQLRRSGPPGGKCSMANASLQLGLERIPFFLIGESFRSHVLSPPVPNIKLRFIKTPFKVLPL